MVKFIVAVMLTLFSIVSCNESKDQNKTTPMPADSVSIKAETVTYNTGSVSMSGFVAYNEASDAIRPVVLVVPEWWGLTDYTRDRAKQLADLGYLAMTIDMYGEGKTAEDPETAGSLATPFYKDPIMAKARFDAALEKIKSYPQADTNKIAAIGYCFGGTQVLNMARLGSDLKGVVSFHGGLLGAPADKSLLKAQVLVCHGEADSFVPDAEVAAFKKQMDSIGAVYIFKSYPAATHAFTNPGADEKAKKYNMPIAYNAAADKASWNDMKAFFDTIFK